MYDLAYLISSKEPLLYLNKRYYKNYNELLEDFEMKMMNLHPDEFESYMGRIFDQISDPQEAEFDLQIGCWLDALKKQKA
jgi:hypothetical protein